MKKSFVASTVRASSRKRSAIGSAHSFGESPAAAAACATFAPCSSVPVSRNASAPQRRAWRVATSAAIVVYAWPRCGSPLT